jgi:hypothetical protein
MLGALRCVQNERRTGANDGCERSQPTYDGAVEPLLDALDVCTMSEWRASGREGLVVLRSTMMDPFLVSSPPAPDHVAGFVGALRRAGEAAGG